MSKQQWDETSLDPISRPPGMVPSRGPASPLDSLIELNAWLGFARACAHSARVQAVLLTLQTDLRALLAHWKDPERIPPLSVERTRWLEETRELLETAIPGGSRSSELPGETVSGAILDLASAVAGRMRDQPPTRERDAANQDYLDLLPGMLSVLARYEEFIVNAPSDTLPK